MKFRNINDCPRYNSIAKSTVLPGRETIDYPGLLNELKLAFYDKNFEVILNPEEEELIEKVLTANKESKARDPKTIKGYDDPYGKKAALEARKEHRRQLNQALSYLHNKSMDRKIQRMDRVISEAETAIEAKLIDDKPKSLAEIMGHNKAIEEKTNG